MSVTVLITGVLIGGISGYAVSRYNKYRAKSLLSKEYFRGLNYLLNEEQDKAIEVLSRLVEADHEMLEVQLALGNLFRRRGEVERAIHLHQHLVAHEELEEQVKTAALFELGEDYMRAGLLDRAEVLFADLASMNQRAAPALINLVAIYQRESEWHEAIKYARQLEQVNNESQARPIAQYYCELVEQALTYGASGDAHTYLQKAFASDPMCIRGLLLEGRLAWQNKHYQKAIDCYEKAITQTPSSCPEVLPHLLECYTRGDACRQGYAFLQKVVAKYDGISAIIALAHYHQMFQGKAKGVGFLRQHLDARPSVRGAIALIDMTMDDSQGEAYAHFQMLRQLAEKLLERQARYRCEHCGFGARAHHWQCPGCKRWDSIKAIRGVAHE